MYVYVFLLVSKKKISKHFPYQLNNILSSFKKPHFCGMFPLYIYPKTAPNSAPFTLCHIFISFLLLVHPTTQPAEIYIYTMEAAMNMKLFLVALIMMVMALSAAAADGPAPAPASDAAVFLPTFLASLAALAFGLLL